MLSLPPIYLLPGMSRDYPIYARMAPLLEESIQVQYLVPKQNESLATYACRMSAGLDPNGYVVGVSFGGIVAQEISRTIRPRGCVIISSVRSPQQFPPWLRLARRLGGRNAAHLQRIIAAIASCVPTLLRAPLTQRAARVAAGAGDWQRWATAAMLDWSGAEDLQDIPLLHIHGDADRTFPIRYVAADVVIETGSHALPVSHPSELAMLIKNFSSQPKT